jgi:hypothetical protein
MGKGTKTIEVSAETHKMLKDLKRDSSHKNMDSVIQSLLSDPPEPMEEDSGEEQEHEEPAEPARKRRKDVRLPLFSFEILEGRRDMMEYYTGFSREQVILIIKTCAKVPFLSFFFCLFHQPMLIVHVPRPPQKLIPYDSLRRFRTLSGGKVMRDFGSFPCRIGS